MPYVIRYTSLDWGQTFHEILIARNRNWGVEVGEGVISKPTGFFFLEGKFYYIWDWSLKEK